MGRWNSNVFLRYIRMRVLCGWVPFLYPPQQVVIWFNNGIDRLCQYFVICI